MTALNSLPPLFLLPAWTYTRLVLFGTKTARSRQFSLLRSLENVEQQGPGGEDTRGYRHTEGLEGTRSSESYAIHRGSRYQKGIDQIKQRLSRKQHPQARKAAYHFVQAEKRLEQHMISSYQERKKKNEQFLEHDGPSVRRVKLQPAHLDPNWIDDADDDLAVARVKAKENSVRDSSSHNDSTDTQLYPPSAQVRRPPERSLLEELFPEEATKLLEVEESSRKLQSLTEAPKLPLPTLEDLQDDSILMTRPQPLPRLMSILPQEPLQPIPSMLVLENAMPNLVEADFRRISPRGKHIEEWKSVFDPIAIAPVRVELPTESTGKYYLVFQASAHAKAWRSRVQLIHEIVTQHSSNSIDSHIIPPSGFKAGGEDIGRLLREYSIFSPGIVPRITLYDNPQMDSMNRHDLSIIKARIQPRDGDLQPGRSVLLWIDGWTLGTVNIIKRMIDVDGRMRHGKWGGPTINTTMVKDYLEEKAKNHNDDDNGDGTKLRPRRNRWTVTLRDEAEARRFVRAWHSRAFPAWEQFGKEDIDEPWPLVKAELLW
ncbi:MAG: hypothetical protein GOMPHAMPRED_003681 [Gomphillus americanus]|uniref:Uncharacterized protein n=1 Tax=Gomphillus americanus TaxID=1940652 RepID=A0A8H3FKN4_9LECA|nr:MAG: hypothetical protein GOMPHAMPRED_003681 [Gomphillus americanus]